MNRKSGSGIERRRHLGRALGPRILDAELFGVHAVGAGLLERRQAPIHGTLEGWSAGNASANLIAQAAKIRFQRRRLECFRNQTIGGFSIGIMIGGEREKNCQKKENEPQAPESASHSGELEMNLRESERGQD